jgi:hypothetical protein
MKGLKLQWMEGGNVSATLKDIIIEKQIARYFV